MISVRPFVSQLRAQSAPILIAAATTCGTAFAFAPQDFAKTQTFGVRTVAFEEGTQVIRPNLRVESPLATANTTLSVLPKLTVKGDTLSGAPRIIYAKEMLASAPVSKDAIEQRDVRAFVEQAFDFFQLHEAALRVRIENIKLVDEATHIGADTQLIKFDVYHQGLVIDDASIAFRFKKGKLIQVANHSFGEAVIVDGPQVQGLGQIAADSTHSPMAEFSRELWRVKATAKGYELVKVREFATAAAKGPYTTEPYRVQVEAHSGAVFEVRPVHMHLDGSASGQIYERWYTEELQTVAYPEIDLDYSGGSVRTDNDGNFTGAPRGARPGIDDFAGAHVNVNPTSGGQPTVDGRSDGNGGWIVDYMAPSTPDSSENKSLAHSMVYYHTTAMVHRAQQYVQSPWFSRQLVANVNLTRTCNAHWDGRTINFYIAGGGCANTALISDVIFHEWGHGFDANTGGIDDGAFSEGYGDTLSMIMTHSPILGIGFRTNGDPVRNLEPNKVYPQDTGGGVHSEGLIIGGTFWDTFKELRDRHGVEEADRLISKYALEVIFTADRYTDVYDALLAIDDDNADLTDQTPNYCSINKAFAEHGLATEDQICKLAAIETFTIDDSRGGDGDGVAEPGESVEVWVTASNPQAEDIIDMSGRLTIDATGFNVTDPNANWVMVPGQGSSRADDPFAVTISSDLECGTTVAANVLLEAADGRTASQTGAVSLGRFEGTVETASPSNLPLPIRDNQTTSATFAFDSSQWDNGTAIKVARLKFEITHTYRGDLTVTLVSPNGSRFEVYDGSGSADDVSFDQDISEIIGGAAGGGQWTFEVHDGANLDEGSLDSVELELTPDVFVCD